MKWGVLAVAVVAIIVLGVVAVSFINRDRVHVYTTQEMAEIECSKRGGNIVSRVGWEDRVHVTEYKCEGVK